MIVEGERVFDAPRATVWQVLNDPASMAKTMPGVESFDVHDAKRWTANVKIAGPVGSMGQRVLQPIVNQQVQHVLGALDLQVQEALAGKKD
jgi:carbon monoxide dehydrogenase subunit G